MNLSCYRVILPALLVAACQVNPPLNPPPALPPTPMPVTVFATPTAAPLVDADSPAATPERPVAVIVNGQPVFADTAVRYSALLAPAATEQAEARRQAVEILIEQAVIEQQAQTLGIAATDEAAQARFSETIKTDPARFEEWLTANGLTRAEALAMFKAQLTASQLIDHLTAGLSDPAEKQQVFAAWLDNQRQAATIEWVMQ
jgi:hypothetical protein